MYINWLKLISVVIVLSLTTACTTTAPNQATPSNNSLQETKKPSDNQSAKSKPATKTGTIFLEGEKTSVNLKLYEDKNLFSTYFPPEDFLVESKTSEQQKEVKFVVNFGGVKNEDAYLQIVFPEKLKNLTSVKELITGENGLIKRNQWKVMNSEQSIEDSWLKKYSWFKEDISFSKGRDIIGNIYIGEEKGKVFYIITHLPREYAEGFSANEELILNNLELGN